MTSSFDPNPGIDRLCNEIGKMNKTTTRANWIMIFLTGVLVVMTGFLIYLTAILV